MNERDKELDFLLDPIRKDAASKFHINRWQLAVKRELEKNLREKFQFNWGWQVLQISASIVLGIIIGNFIFTSSDKEEFQSYVFANKVNPTATYEYIYAKSPIED